MATDLNSKIPIGTARRSKGVDHRRKDTALSDGLLSVTFSLMIGELCGSLSIVVISEIDIWIGISCWFVEGESILMNKPHSTRATSITISFGFIGNLRWDGGMGYSSRRCNISQNFFFRKYERWGARKIEESCLCLAKSQDRLSQYRRSNIKVWGCSASATTLSERQFLIKIKKWSMWMLCMFGWFIGCCSFEVGFSSCLVTKEGPYFIESRQMRKLESRINDWMS